jgi:aldose 1-epimerase
VFGEIIDQPLNVEPFGRTDEGRLVKVYTLVNDNGLELRTMNCGGTILSLRVPDRDGSFDDVVLGLDTYDKYYSEKYLDESPYFGAIIGRYSNRIAGGQFELNGAAYQLPTNDGPNHLHGGAVGFDRRFWSGHPFIYDGEPCIRYRYVSPDGEQGYPGTLTVSVTYRLTHDDTVVVSYEATTSEATPVNLTLHTYFNLAGHDANDVLDHRLTLNADYFTPVDETLIPTGEIREVKGSAFDFRTPTPIGARIEENDQQLQHGKGYDHNFVINSNNVSENKLTFAARVFDHYSGRELTVHTTEPGLQFYSGNALTGVLAGKDGAVYDRYSGFCLETQHFPDSPNRSSFPSTIVRPDETYRSQTRFSFSTRS